ncbi:MAG: histone deacetylase [Candidatus Sericytochromatia bacterium]|nr:MAG: histone deacetylase [Candidatus Sericytochromatia bacterium]
MNLGIVNSDIFKKHDTGFHPENSSRLEVIDSAIDKIGRKIFFDIEPQKIDLSVLYKIHSKEYVSFVEKFCNDNEGRIDEDTVVSNESYNTAIYACGSVIKALEFILQNSINKVFCFIRPPGHHALPNKTMGFCLFNNLSVAINEALEKYRLKRVAVLDFDVHHGNGTEQIFYNSNKVLTISWHQYPFWPFSGSYNDIGTGKGEGYNINIPIPEGFSDYIYFETFENIVLPALKKFNPEMIFVAAGYDAHYKDPLGGLNATDNLYKYLSFRINQISDELCNGRLLLTLEGGYNLEALHNGVYNTLLSLLYKYDRKYKISKNENENQYIFNLINNIIAINKLLN